MLASLFVSFLANSGFCFISSIIDTEFSSEIFISILTPKGFSTSLNAGGVCSLDSRDSD